MFTIDTYRVVVMLVPLHNDDLGFESNCFVCEQRNQRGLRVPFAHDTDRHMVVADFALGDSFSGAPTMVHGGVVLALLDEAMAWACIAIAHRWAVTSETTTKFHGAVYIDKDHRVEAEIVDRSDTEIGTTGRIVDMKGRVRAESIATFTVLGEAQFKRAAGVDANAVLDEAIRLD